MISGKNHKILFIMSFVLYAMAYADVLESMEQGNSTDQYSDLYEEVVNVTQIELDQLESEMKEARLTVTNEDTRLRLLEEDVEKYNSLYIKKLNVFSNWMTANSVCSGHSFNYTDVEGLWDEVRKISRDIELALNGRQHALDTVEDLRERLVKLRTESTEMTLRYNRLLKHYQANANQGFVHGLSRVCFIFVMMIFIWT